MQRRTFLRAARPRRAEHAIAPAAAALTTNLDPYTGEWSTAEAAFLLRRTTFGTSPARIKQAVSDGLGATLGALFAPLPLPEPPVYYDYEDDPNAGLGESWVDFPILNPAPPGIFGGRNRSLKGWQMGLMMDEGTSIRETLVLFWLNHFPVATTNHQFAYHYLHILRTHAQGSFRAMVEEVTVSPPMLLYLNGHQNSVQAPNENYSRELLELFTIGRGPAAGPGDYTNYTEDDVLQMARALTGWRARVLDTGMPSGIFNPERHDTGDKQLSHRFDNAVITDAGDQEYKTVIDLILQKEETARFVCRQLHVWFVGADIDAVTEANIIGPMAQILLDNDYHIQPALEALLGSNYFFEATHRGCMTTHPIDFTFRIVNTFEMQADATLLQRYRLWNQFRRLTEGLEMSYFDPPSVAGWKAFYQAPLYYDNWINSVSLTRRQEATERLLEGFTLVGVRWRLNLIDFVGEMDDATDPNAMLDQIALYLFAFPMSETQRDFLKEILIPGLPDFEWTVEYSQFLADPDDPDLREAILTKLEALFSTIFKMPEFQLI